MLAFPPERLEREALLEGPPELLSAGDDLEVQPALVAQMAERAPGVPDEPGAQDLTQLRPGGWQVDHRIRASGVPGDAELAPLRGAYEGGGLRRPGAPRGQGEIGRAAGR